MMPSLRNCHAVTISPSRRNAISHRIVASEPVVDTQPEQPRAEQAADAQPEQTIEPVPAQQLPAVEQQSAGLIAEQGPADDTSEH